MEGNAQVERANTSNYINVTKTIEYQKTNNFCIDEINECISCHLEFWSLLLKSTLSNDFLELQIITIVSCRRFSNCRKTNLQFL
jgi:hypothetical protein